MKKAKIIINNIIVSILTLLICCSVFVGIIGLTFSLTLTKRTVVGYSMWPLLNEDAPSSTVQWDTVYVNKYQDLKRNDIVIANVKWKHQTSVIKHLIGMPGDQIKIKIENENYVLYCNNQIVYKKQITDQNKFGTYEDYLNFISSSVWNSNVITDEIGDDCIRLNDDEYFIAGFNWAETTDSFDYGPISRSQIFGKVEFTIHHNDNVFKVLTKYFWKALTEI